MTQGETTASRAPGTLEAAQRLVASGVVTSRSELAAELGVSASTASLLVKRLVADGLVREVGAGESTGGRRPTLLEAVTPAGSIAVAELGGRHLRFGLCDLAGELLVRQETPIDIGEGPEAILDRIDAAWSALVAAERRPAPLAVALALPGPVNAQTGEVVGPSRMPGWHGSRPVALLAQRHDCPVLVENDARAAAMGEYAARGSAGEDLLYVKAGTGIGAGLVVHGGLFTGGRGVAGDIAHVRVTDEPTRCACGRLGCLEAVASGAAIADRLRARGVPVDDTRHLVRRGLAQEPEVSGELRTAGERLGRALAPLVNFLNPHRVVVGGALSGTDSFVAAARSSLYQHALPMCTQELAIETAAAGPDAALRGLGRLGRDRVTTP